MFIVQIFEELPTGDGYYRQDEPARVMGSRDEIIFIDCHHLHSQLYPLIEQCDVLLTSFFSHLNLFDLIEWRRRQGKVTVFETADYYHEPQPWNPIAVHWLDPDVLHEHERYIAAADAVQTSTPRLADLWRDTARKIVVFENQLSEVPALEDRVDRPFTIGWAGSQGHLADWFHACSYLQPWLDEHPDVHVAVMTLDLAKDFLRLSPERYYFSGAGGIADYQNFLKRLDVGLVPLLPIEWNRSRSDVKFLEYAAYGVAGIYSDLGPYNAAVQPGETGLFYHSPEEMISALDRLYADREEVEHIRRKAHEYVSGQRRLEQYIDQRLNFYRDLLGGSGSSPALPPDLLNGAVIQKNYIRLNRDAAGEQFRTAAERADAQALSALTALVQQNPGFLLARMDLARKLISHRAPQEALAVLAALPPHLLDSSRVLGERGRAATLVGEVEKGREYLVRAVKLDPHSVMLWDSLIRYLRSVSAEGSADLLAELQALHPLSWRLFFLALPLYEFDRQIEELSAYLSRIEVGLSPDHLEAGAAVICRGIFRCCSQEIDSAKVRELIHQGRSLFPASALLLTLDGLAAHRGGDTAAALRLFAEAAATRKTAKLYAAEHDERSLLHYYSLIGERICALD